MFPSAEWATFGGHPYPAAPDLPKGKRLTRFSGRYCSPTNRVRLPLLFKGQNKPLYASLQTADSGLSLSYELLKEKFNKSIFPAGAAFFTVLFFFR